MQKTLRAWTLVDFRQASSGKDGRAGGGGGGGDATDWGRGAAMPRTSPAWDLAQFGRDVFRPWRPLDVIKPWQARTFAAAELAPSMTLKS